MANLYYICSQIDTVQKQTINIHVFLYILLILIGVFMCDVHKILLDYFLLESGLGQSDLLSYAPVTCHCIDKKTVV